MTGVAVAKTSCQKRLFIATIAVGSAIAMASYTLLHLQVGGLPERVVPRATVNDKVSFVERAKSQAVLSAGSKAELGRNSSELAMDGVVVKELPDFWRPPPGSDLDSLASAVQGQPTIFLGIASYRDPLCHTTIHEALRWAEHPHRLFFGAVEQNAESEAPELACDYTAKPCEEDDTQLLCAHRSQIRLFRVDAAQARGPCFGRHRVERLYRGEHFALQLDAHMFFVKGWDTKIIEQWKATGNEYAVLSTYPSDYRNTISASGEGLTHTAPLICSSKFEGDGMVRHNAAGEIVPDRAIVGDSPILVPLWGAGISFSRGHRIVRVPYDCCLDMIFSGEEFSMAVRMWTHGYDFYSPHPSVAFHWYNRPKPPKTFWENSRRAGDAAQRSARRILALLGDAPSRGGYDAKGIGVGERYGLGARRPLALFMKFFGYDVKARKARNNCPFVFSMAMHKELVPHMCRDRKGINYTDVPVDALLEKYFPKQMEGLKCDYGLLHKGFLAGCAQECRAFSDQDEAEEECSKDSNCGGITFGGDGPFQLRAGEHVFPSPAGERSLIKGHCEHV